MRPQAPVSEPASRSRQALHFPCPVGTFRTGGISLSEQVPNFRSCEDTLTQAPICDGAFPAGIDFRV